MQEFYIKNLYCAGYLLTKGIQPIRVIKNYEGKRLIFYKNTEELHNTIAEFYDNTNLINFVKSVLELKREIYKI